MPFLLKKKGESRGRKCVYKRKQTNKQTSKRGTQNGKAEIFWCVTIFIWEMASDQWQEEFGTEKKLQSDFRGAKIHLITVWHRIGTKNVQSNSLIPLASASLSSSKSMAIRFICRKNCAQLVLYQHSRGRCTYLSDDPQTVKRKKKNY